MSCRLLVAPERLAAGVLEVRGDDHHYLFRVRRLRIGDRVILFDGAGREASAGVESVSGERARLRVEEVRPAPTTSRPRMVVLQALIKGDRMEGTLRQLVELGADLIVPVQAARSVVVLQGTKARERRERYQRVAEGAARQCRRATVPEISEICALEPALARAAGCPLKLLLWEGARAAPMRSALPDRPVEAVCLLSGPEGGFEDEEVERAGRAGFAAVGLGPRILRAETAAVAALSIVGCLLGDLGRPTPSV